MNRSNIGIILLAAGASSRMGRSKQLLTIDNKPLLTLSAEAAVSSLATKTVVVLGASQAEHSAILKHFPIDIAINHSWQKGMGSSLKCGLEVLLKSDHSISGVVILVCDQPLISAAHINKLIEKHRETQKPVIASCYAQTAGVPVFFARTYFAKLLELNDNHGARKIVQENVADVAVVDFPEGEIDLDTLADYERFRHMYRRHDPANP